MKRMIIDEKTEGIINEGWRFKIEGNLFFDGILDIRVNLYVTGFIEAGKWIEAGEWIEAGKGIKAGEWIKAGKGIKAGKWIEAGEWIKAGKGIEAGLFIRGAVKKIFGIKTNFHINLSLFWSIHIFTKHMKIGCELHTIEEWENFTDDDIERMDDHALNFWKENKEMLLGIYYSKTDKK